MKEALDVMLAAIVEDVDKLEKACNTIVESKRNERNILKQQGEFTNKQLNGNQETNVEDLQDKIYEMEAEIEAQQWTINKLHSDNEALQREIELLKAGGAKGPNGTTQNGIYSLNLDDSGSIKEWQREKQSLCETNQMLLTKIQMLMAEAEKYREKLDGVSDAILHKKEKKDFLTKLDDFEFLFRQDSNSYKPTDIQPIDKLSKILESVKTMMSHYFHFVVLAIKYDSIQSGNSKFCNLDAAALYEQAATDHIFHQDWPLFILGKLTNTSPPPIRPRSLTRSLTGSVSGFFSPNNSGVPKRVTWSPEITRAHK